MGSARVVPAPERDVVSAAPYAGVVTRWAVLPGQRVAAGAAIGQWVSSGLSEAQRDLQQARIEADLTQRQLKRDRSLWDEGLIAQTRLEDTQARAQAAQAQLKMRQAQWEAATGSIEDSRGLQALRAPISGVVVELLAKPGQRVEAGAPLMRVADLSVLHLEISLSPEQARSVRVGDSVQVQNPAARGVVISVSPALETTQQVLVRARLTQPGPLMAGETVTAHVLRKD
jgi:RND family efflux transporter MFP subunit